MIWSANRLVKCPFPQSYSVVSAVLVAGRFYHGSRSEYVTQDGERRHPSHSPLSATSLATMAWTAAAKAHQLLQAAECCADRWPYPAHRVLTVLSMSQWSTLALPAQRGSRPRNLPALLRRGRPVFSWTC